MKKWNNKGQVIFYALMVGLVIAILALALAPAVQESINLARNQSTDSSIGLDCDNESISNFDKAACVTTDITLPYFIGFLIFLAGAVVLGRMVFSD